MEAARAFQLIREAQPMTNPNHNLIQTLSEKLDGAARYNLYEEDAGGMCPRCMQLYEQLKQDDQRHVQMLRDEIANHVRDNMWK